MTKSAPEEPGLLERRIPHLIAGYLAAGWAVVEATAFFVERYRLPDQTLDVLLLISLAGFLPAIILTWRHGLPGSQSWTRSELGVSMLLFLAVLGGGYSLDWGPKAKRQRKNLKARMRREKPAAYDKETFQFEADSISLRDALEVLGKKAGLNVSVAEAIQDLPVNLKLKDVRMSEAFEILARHTETSIRVVGSLIEAKELVDGLAPPAPGAEREFKRLKARNRPLAKVLQLLGKAGDLDTSVHHSVADIPVTVDLAQGYSIEEALNIIARQTGTEIRIIGTVIEAQPQGPSTP